MALTKHKTILAPISIADTKLLPFKKVEDLSLKNKQM